jgi:endo-1,4-beta-xylanase
VQKRKAKSQPAPFRWAQEMREGTLVRHGVFKSASMGLDVGYCVYLPPGYDDKASRDLRYPVVYHLHGGRRGSELKSVKLASFVDAAIREAKIAPMIYVFPNGGPMSWYNYPQIENGNGEDVFVKETIPHIDLTYRTIAKREGRGLEGFSQGGRGTTRIMLKYPEMFVSAAPGGSGYEPEKRIQENDGAESETVRFAPGYNTWDLAAEYAKSPEPPLNILIWVGTKGFNYEYNLKFMDYLTELKIPHSSIIVEGAPHSAAVCYEKRGLDLMQYHQKHFRR